MNRPVVLCVDDERIILSSLKAQLQNNLTSDLQIEVAESAEEALEIIQELISDNIDIPLVIADQIMPGMKGDEFLSHVKKISPNTLTIMLTGQASADAVGKAVNKGGLFRYLSKPWDEDDLILTVQSAIDSYAHQKKLLKQTQYQAVLNQTLSLALSTLSFGKQISTALQYVLSIPCISPHSQGVVYFINTSHVFNSDYTDQYSKNDLNSPPPITELIHFQRLCDHTNDMADNELIIPVDDIENYAKITFTEKTNNGLAHYICPILIDGDLIGLTFIYVPSYFSDDQDLSSFLFSFTQTVSGMYRLSKSNHDLRISNHHLEKHKFELEDLVIQRTDALNKALIAQEDNNSKLRAANKELAFFATIDSLTGLLNRRHFFALAEQRSSLLKRQQKNCVIAMVDIDFFKDINDSFGHQVGDEALKNVAQLIKQNFDENTLICRFGGEEFAILVPNLDLDTAFDKCNELLNTIETAKLIILSEAISLTVSIGLSEIKQQDIGIDKALFRADKALYVSKDNGRNTVSIFKGEH
tara:strand:- start:4205 stop:5788 length:1584 start_codon:yes stop_codon:yes gene_type:complete